MAQLRPATGALERRISGATSDLATKRARSDKPGNETENVPEEVPTSNVSFFKTLNYDLRYIIYDGLYFCLPPLIHPDRKDLDCQGMILSCKQAYAELLEVASRHRTRFFEEQTQHYKREFAIDAEIVMLIPRRDAFARLQQVTLSIPVSSSIFSITGSYNGPDRQQYLNWKSFRSLLNLPFEKFTILVTDPEISTNPKGYPEYSTVIRSLRFGLRNVAETIGKEWRQQLEAKAILRYCEEEPYYRNLGLSHPHPPCNSSAGIVKSCQHPEPVTWKDFDDRHGERVRHHACMHTIKTKYICFAWDFLPGRSARLIGAKMMYNGRTETTNEWDEDEYDVYWPHYFWVEDHSFQSLVGKEGLFHPRGWDLGGNVEGIPGIPEVPHATANLLNWNIIDEMCIRKPIECSDISADPVRMD